MDLGHGDARSVLPPTQPPKCESTVEFAACPDGALAITPDASFAETDAGSVQDAGPLEPDPAVVEGPCRMWPGPSCNSEAKYRVDVTHAQCDLLDQNRIRTRYGACEVCGSAGSFTQVDVMIADCSQSCVQVYREGTWSSNIVHATAANQCEESIEATANLKDSAASNCIDVYGTANSWKDDNSTGVHQARLCRCDRAAGTCVMCADGSCD